MFFISPAPDVPMAGPCATWENKADDKKKIIAVTDNTAENLDLNKFTPVVGILIKLRRINPEVNYIAAILQLLNKTLY